MKRIALLFLSLWGLFLSSVAAPPGISGTLKIGPGATYPTLTGAISALAANGLSGPVILELQSNYTSANETFPVTIPALPGVSDANQVSIRPAANATALVISALGYNAAFVLNSARYINIDGRPGGTGAEGKLRITSDQSTSPAVIFNNECAHNSIRYTELTAFMNDPTNGIITMTAEDWTSGNTYNSIENCSIHGIKGKSVFKGIYSIAGEHARNSFNTVKNCNFYDCGGHIYLGKYNSDWQIINNDFYTVEYKNFDLQAIYITDETGSGYNITDNAIGGSGPDCSGQKPNIPACIGIWVQSSHAGFNNILRNKVANIEITNDDDDFYTFLGIFMQGGSFNCSGNIIGETDNTGKSISVTYTPQGAIGGISAGGFFGSVDTCIISGNKVGGINGIRKQGNDESHIFGINAVANFYSEISKNYVGSTSVQNSLSINGTGTNRLIGIMSKVNNSAGVNMVSGNFVGNLRGWGAGIETAGGISSIINNTVRDISGTALVGSSGNAIGINVTGAYNRGNGSGNVVSGNVVHSISTEDGESSAVGIRLDYTSNTLVERNLVHSIACSAVIDWHIELSGISLHDSDHSTIKNNMIRVGLDSQGKNIPGAQEVTGIYIDGNGTDVMNNTVFVDGEGTNTAAAFRIYNDSLPVNLNNNILVNTRVVKPAAGYQYDSYIMAYGKNLSANYNCYYFRQSENSYISGYNRGKYSDIRAWRKATGLDSNSFVYAPGFMNPTGDLNWVDLHIKGPSPVKGAGSYNSSVTEDFDGEKRDPSSPDIGADAGNYTYQDGDAPMLKHDAFIGQPVISNYVYRVRIVDNVGGVDTTAGKAPRMWLRKSYPQKGAWFSVEGSKLSGNANEGIWGFHPDLSKAGTTLSPGDSLEYYFVAQDKGPVINIGYSNRDSTKHTDVNTQLTAPASPARLLIYGLFPDTVYVGEGNQYTSLTNEGGFFQTTGSMSFDTTKANTYVVITSDLSEKGIYPMKMLTKSRSKITILTNTPVRKTIKKVTYDDKHRPMITLLGVANVIIDGTVSGSGRYLRFENVNMLTGFETEAMLLNGPSENIRLTNLEFASNNRLRDGTFSMVGTLKRITLENSLFTNVTRDDGSQPYLPNFAITIFSTAVDTMTIRNNEINNFAENGIQLSGDNIAGGRLNITNNHFYYNSPIVNEKSPVAVQVSASRGTLNISHNYIGGSEPFCGGAKWRIVTNTDRDGKGNSYIFTGINVKGSQNDSITIQGNVISQIKLPKAYATMVTGIFASGPNVYIGTEKGNVIGSQATDTSILAGGIQGISAETPGSGTASAIATISNNIVTGLSTINHLEAFRFNSEKLIVNRNQVFSVSSTEGELFDITTRTGIISENVIRDCKFESPFEYGGVSGTGMTITQMSPQTLPAAALVIERNTIDLQCNTVVAGTIPVIGIKGNSTAAVFKNNQINISTGAPSTIEVHGISISTSYSRPGKPSNRIIYNSIYLSGQALDTASSHGIYINDMGPQEQVMNNIIYNNRTGGTGKHLALTSVSSVPFALTANNNLYVTSGTGALNSINSTIATNIEQWRNISGKDAASYATASAYLPPATFFRSAATGNLDINTQSATAWLVNGKGMPVADVYNDFGDSSHIRSVELRTGATDIGSDEFNTTTTPPALTIAGDHTPGGTEQMSYNGRVIASITWGSTGTLPTLGIPVFYSGEWPKDATNNGTVTTARFMNGYWDISATGGSNYSYSLTLSYDSSMLGEITDAANMVLNKREPGVNGSWKTLTPSIVDTVAKTVTVYNQTSFSEFALTDSLAPATAPAQLADIRISADGADQTRPNTQYDLQYKETNSGTGYALPHKVQIYLSADNVLTPGTNGDSLLAIINSDKIGAGASVVSGKLSLKFGCNLQPGQYYIIAKADPDNTIPESNKTNNTSILKVQLLPAADLTFTSDKTAVCAGEKITFTASGATSFTFSGSMISNVKDLSFDVNTISPGNYTYTATAVSNGCTVAKTANITINGNPQVTATSSSDGICEGQKVKLTGDGALSYVWRGENAFYPGQSFEPELTGTGSYTFMFTGMDQNGCKGMASATFSVGSLVEPSVTIDYSGCPGKVLPFQAHPVNGGDFPQYKWYVNNELKGTGAYFTLNDATNSTEVYVVMNSSAPCTGAVEVSSAPAKINCVVTAIPEIDGMEAYSIYPNPGEGLFYVRTKLSTTKDVRLLIADAVGNVIMVIPSSVRYGDVIIPIDLRNKPNGLYYIQATVGNKTFTSKVIKL